MSWKRSILITGGTSGLGYHTALLCAKAHPTSLVVICSRSDKDNAAESIKKGLSQDNVIFKPLDLSRLASVRGFAKDWASNKYPPIESLLLNAGVQYPGDFVKTSDDLEATFGVNHVGHALLFHLLWPFLSNNARVIVTASGVHDPAQNSGLPDAKFTSGDDLAFPPPSVLKESGRQHYSNSKLANILWVYALENHLKGKRPQRVVTVNAFDPGLMPGTGLAREAGPFLRFLWLQVLPRIIPLLRRIYTPNVHTAAESGEALARLAVGADAEGVTGKYFEGMKEIPSSVDSYVEEKQDSLWNWTVKYLSQDETELSSFNTLGH